ncbi:hypothetical protein [Amorphus coralli]|uniref:hypothetical protein n=1 Tax=Amorphus coralli TaxID=340680 RepID=UPI00035E3959|nr:hypothetical protein [Amorphus coralli]
MTDPSYIASAKDDSGDTQGYLRLGAYVATEDGDIEKSLTAGDGMYLMTSARFTTDVSGPIYIEAGDGMSVKGDKSITITDAGETSLRAMTVGIAAKKSPETDDQNITLASDGALTLDADAGIEITCERFVFVVNQNLKISREAKGQSAYASQTIFTMGGKTGVYWLNNTDISGALRWEPRIFDHKFALIDSSAVIVKGTGEVYKLENFGLRAFLVGLFLPFKGAEAKAVVAENNDDVVAVDDAPLSSEQNGAESEVGLFQVGSSDIFSN